METIQVDNPDLDHAVQTRSYRRHPDGLPLCYYLYREICPPSFPARTTLTNCLPPTLRYDIEAVAVWQLTPAAEP